MGSDTHTHTQQVVEEEHETGGAGLTTVLSRGIFLVSDDEVWCDRGVRGRGRGIRSFVQMYYTHTTISHTNKITARMNNNKHKTAQSDATNYPHTRSDAMNSIANTNIHSKSGDGRATGIEFDELYTQQSTRHEQ